MSKGRRHQQRPMTIRKPLTPPAETRSVTATFESQSISSPAPPPAWLAAYEHAHPGTAERILTMCEGQVAHRHELERWTVQERLRFRGRGQWMGLAVAIAMLVVAAFAIYCKETAAACTAIGAIATVVGLFVYQSRRAALSSTDNRPDGT